MAFALVQSAEGTSASAAVTGLAFSVAPTAGNLIVLALQTTSVINTPDAGWQQASETHGTTSQYIWWRLATGANSFPYTLNATANSSWILAEFSGGPDQIDTFAMQSVTSSGTSYTTPSIVPGSGERLLLAAMGGNFATGDASADQTTWLNSFTHIRTSGPASGTAIVNLGLGYRVVTGDDSTAFSSGSTFAITLASRSGSIAAFKAVGNLTGASTPAFRSLSSLSYASHASSTVTAPAGLANNDIMLALVFGGASGGLGSSPVITPPAGWKALCAPHEVTDGSFTGRLWMFWKRAASESGSYVFTHATASTQAVIAAYSGCVTSGTPIDGFSFNFSSSVNTDAAPVSPNSTNDLLVYGDLGWAAAVTDPPTGFTERYDATLLTMSSSTAPVTARGDTGSVGHTTTSPWAAYLVALRGPVGGIYSVTATAGSYALTGTAATLVKSSGDRLIAAVTGSYALTGTAATLIKTGGGGGALPVYRSTASTSYGSNASATVCAAPAGTVNGDILVAGIFAGKDGPGIATCDEIGITPPAGWTQVGTTLDMFTDGFCGTYWVFWKRASSEAASYSFTHVPLLGTTSDTFSTQAVISAYSGCRSSGNPVDVFSQNTSSGSTATATGITTTTANTKLVYAGSNWDASGTLTPPAGMTERFDNLVYWADQDAASAGATGSRTQTQASSASWSAVLLALLPAPAVSSTYWLTATSGLYALTGTAATLRKTSPNRVLAVAGSYTLTGTTVTTGRGLMAAGGSYSFTGKPASLVVNGRNLLAARSSYSFTGSSTAFALRRGFLAAAGHYTVTGSPVTLTGGTVVPSGLRVWTGSAWADKPIRVWTGSGWTEKPVKVWNGSAWI